MNKTKFYVDYCFEAGSFENGSGGNVCQRYWFEMVLTEKEFEELYQVWFSNNCKLNNWDTNWEGHDVLFQKLNEAAYHALNDLLKEHEPDFADPINAHWEISKETQNSF